MLVSWMPIPGLSSEGRKESREKMSRSLQSETSKYAKRMANVFKEDILVTYIFHSQATFLRSLGDQPFMRKKSLSEEALIGF